MKRNLLALLGLAVLLPCGNAAAIGLGGYIEGGLGTHAVTTQYYEIRGDWDTVDLDLDSGTAHLGVGFVLGTAVARDTLFNYRLSLGYRHTWLRPDDWADVIDETFQGNGFSIDNAFGFGIVRTESIRLWVGPSVRLAGVFYDDASIPVPGFLYEESKTDLGWDFNLRFGPEIGVNLHLGDAMSLAVTGGYQYHIVWRIQDRNLDDHYEFEDFQVGREHLFFMNIAILFRTDSDTFQFE